MTAASSGSGIATASSLDGGGAAGEARLEVDGPRHGIELHFDDTPSVAPGPSAQK